jgi:adenosylmethionine-8-amino-7-oxononanoate aminotransferase
MVQYSAEELERYKQDVRYVWLDFTQMEGFRQDPLIILEGEGIRCRSIDGKEYIDAIAGASVTSIGYGNHRVREAIKRQADELLFWPILHSTTVPAVQLARLLADLLPADLNNAFLLSGGSEATECAMKMARQYHVNTGNPLRNKIVARYWSYHGSTKGALSASGVADKQVFEPFLAGFIHVLPPYCYRCPFGQIPQTCDIECACAIDWTLRLEGRRTVAAVIVDPVMAAAGVIVPPKAYYQIIREACDRSGTLLIFDEVLTGFGRTGHLFAANMYDVLPDIVCLGKGISGGYAPLAATVARDNVAQGFLGPKEAGLTFLHGNTFGGHPLACATGLAAIGELLERDLVGNARRMGAYMRDRLLEMQAQHPIIGDVRGAGLIVGLELVRNRETRSLFGKAQAPGPMVCQSAFERGLIIRGSLHVVQLTPPLIITKAEVDEILEILEDCISSVEAKLLA